MTDIQHIFQAQKHFFHTGKTLPIAFRVQALKRLYRSISRHQNEITQALYLDLGKSEVESYITEIGGVLSEISYFIKHIKKFAAPKKVMPAWIQFPGKCFIETMPYGVTWIISPWNYPFLLSMQPLVTAIAAGNTAICTTSPYAKHTHSIVRQLCLQCFPSKYVYVHMATISILETLSKQPFDHIFFTGSPTIGKTVMKNAAAHLTPVTLELGGKSPCIVDETADIPLAAKRIVFGKFINCGQTCIAPDYVYCHRSIKKQLIQALKKAIEKQYGKHPLENTQYGHIIHQKHFLRLQNLMQHNTIVYGGQSDARDLKIAPTLFDDVSFSDPIMQEEIFGPLLPILTFETMDEVISKMQALPAPLALYLFTNDTTRIQTILQKCQSGGVCINDTILHIAGNRMGFGGVGNSGMGAYHGKVGFDTFSHKKSVLQQSNHFDLPLRYPPYSPTTKKIFSFFFS